MPKMRTNKSAAKRFKVTGNGKIARRKAGLRHRLISKTPGQRKRARKSAILFEGDVKRISKTIPYAF